MIVAISDSDAPRGRRQWTWEIVAAFVVSVVAILLFTWPLALHFADHMYGPRFGDALGSIWNLWRQEQTGPRLAGLMRLEWVGAPFGSESLTGADATAAVLLLPAYVISKIWNEVVAWNVSVVTGLAFPGATTYIMLRYLRLGRWAAAWGGLAFMLFPWHVLWGTQGFSSGHLESLPLCVLAVVAWSRKPTWGRAAWIAAPVLLAWLSNAYTGLMALIITAAAVVVVTIFGIVRRGWRSALMPVLPVVGFVVLVLLPFAAILRFQGGQAASRAPLGVGELQMYGLRPLELIAPTQFQNVLADWGLSLRQGIEHGSNSFETAVYLGLFTIVLVLVWLVVAVVKRKFLSPEERLITWLAVGIGLSGLLIAAPGQVTVGPMTLRMPSYFLFSVAPFWRVYSRLAVVVMLAAVILGALALQFLMRRAGRAGILVGAGAITISAFELPVFVPPDRVSPLNDGPAYASILAEQPAGIVAGYPLASPDQGINSDWLFWQRLHRQRLLNGGTIDTRPDLVRRGLEGITDPGTVNALAAMGVRYVVVNRSAYGDTPPPMRLPGLRRIGGDDAGTVYRVVADPAGGVVAINPGGTEVGPDGRVRRWLGGDAADFEVIVGAPGRYRVTAELGSWEKSRRVVVRLGGAVVRTTVGTGTTTVGITADLPKGGSPMRVTWAPPAGILPDGRSGALYATTPRVERLDAPPVPIAPSG